MTLRKLRQAGHTSHYYWNPEEDCTLIRGKFASQSCKEIAEQLKANDRSVNACRFRFNSILNLTDNEFEFLITKLHTNHGFDDGEIKKLRQLRQLKNINVQPE